MLVREHPGLQVHVSEVGAPHFVDPSRLDASARRLYGDAFDALWGELAPVPAANVHVVGENVVGLDCFPTPGHASHHVSYLGVRRHALRRRRGRRAARAEAASSCRRARRPSSTSRRGRRRSRRSSAARRRASRSSTSASFDDVQEHLAALRETLARWSERVENGMDEESFIAAARYDVSADRSRPGRRVPARRRRTGTTTTASSATGASGARRPPDGLLNACASRSASETNSSAEACVASSTTGGATPASSASCQRAATTHQRSPGTRPGNIHCGCGVTRSFPREHRELEELLGHDRADDVEAEVRAGGVAVPVAEVARHGIERAGLELAAEDVHDPKRRASRRRQDSDTAAVGASVRGAATLRRAARYDVARARSRLRRSSSLRSSRSRRFSSRAARASSAAQRRGARAVSVENVVGLVLAVAVLAYLVYALLAPGDSC